MQGPADAGARLVQLEVQRDAEGRGPVALQHVAVEVDPDDVVGTELRPGEQPGVAEQGAVALVHRDVAGEVVVVPLVPEGAGEEHDLLPVGEVGRQPVPGRVEAHRGLHGRRTRDRSHPTGHGAKQVSGYACGVPARPPDSAARQAARLEHRRAALAARPGMSPAGPAPDRLRIATWNLNSLRARLPAVDRFLGHVGARRALPAGDQGRGGVGGRRRPVRAPRLPQRARRWGTYNGVGIVARHPIRDVVASGDFGDDTLDREPRVISGVVELPAPVRFVSVYVPHGRTVDHWHYEYKLAFVAVLTDRVQEWRATGDTVVVAGDVNIAATDSDVFHPDTFVGSTHVTPRGTRHAGPPLRDRSGRRRRRPLGTAGAAGSRGGTTASATRATSACASTSSRSTVRSLLGSTRRGSTTSNGAPNVPRTMPPWSPICTLWGREPASDTRWSANPAARATLPPSPHVPRHPRRRPNEERMTTPDLPFASPYRHDLVRVAAAVPLVRLGDPQVDAEHTVDLARQAHDDDAARGRVPGARAGGLQQPGPVPPGRLAARRPRRARRRCATRRSTCARCWWSGLPLRVGHQLFNVAAVVHRGRVLGVVPKSYLPNYREFYEKRQFSAARQAITDSRRAARRAGPVRHRPAVRRRRRARPRARVEICEDVWVPIPPSTYATHGGRHRAGQPVGQQHHDRQGRVPPRAVLGAVGPHDLRPTSTPAAAGRVDHRPRVGRSRA